MPKYRFELTGVTPFLAHADSIPWSDKMAEWRKDPDNAKTSVAGDDRSPAFRWLGVCYHDGKHFVVPAEMIQRALMSAAAMLPTGRRGKTFKQASMSGMGIMSESCEFLVGGKKVPWAPIQKLADEPNFAKHQSTVAAMGFELFLKRAKIGQSKHIRVRPRFNEWAVRGEIEVWDKDIGASTLKDMFRLAGERVGIGNWRPSCPTPGPFGRFLAKVEEVNGAN